MRWGSHGSKHRCACDERVWQQPVNGVARNQTKPFAFSRCTRGFSNEAVFRPAVEVPARGNFGDLPLRRTRLVLVCRSDHQAGERTMAAVAALEAVPSDPDLGGRHLGALPRGARTIS